MLLATIDSWLAAAAPYPLFYLPLALLVGLTVGSFLNVVIVRTPKILEQQFRSECCDLLALDKPAQPKLTLSTPASHCPHCGHKITPWENIPLISYVLLKGRCSHCRASISPRYPLIELATGLLSLLTLYLLGLNSAGLFALLLLWVLIALTMIDIDSFLLPDHLTLPLLWLGLLLNTGGLYTDLHSALWGAAAGYLSLWSVFCLFKQVTGKEGMGYGDFKLLAALGAWLGWQLLPLVIVLSSFVGALIGIGGILFLGRDKNLPIPFGPYLAIAGLIALLWGEPLLTHYLPFLSL
ncbi:MAG: A24 family peptidase [Cellvibrionaceae bacterium]|nr:A24 family peptidase [Cellvibrionaceae bacterium]